MTGSSSVSAAKPGSAQADRAKRDPAKRDPASRGSEAASATARPALALRAWEWPLAALVAWALLSVLRRASLSTPYWWDAAAVYVPGSRWLEAHDFMAIPGVFPSLLGRGHTTLYYVINALVFRVFGDEPVVGHAVVLAFAAMTLVYTYALGTWMYGRLAGVSAALLLAVSPLFLTMSSMALPEVPLMAVSVASVYAFSRGRHAEAALWGVAVVLIKETGLACPLALVGALLCWGLRTKSFAHVARPLSWASLPLVVLLAFFVWQRVAEGWWVLPFHAELFEGERDYLANGTYTLETMVASDGRFVALIAAAFVMGWRIWKGEPAFVSYGAKEDPRVPPRWVAVAALALLFLANQVFFTKMWFLERYALAAHPAVVVLIAGALVPALGKLRQLRPLHGAAALALSATFAIALSNQYAGVGYDSGETTFRYLHAIEAHQRAYTWLQARGGETPVVLTTWPMSEEMTEPSLGFVDQRIAQVRTPGSYFEDLEAGRDMPVLDYVLTQDGLGRHDALRSEAERLGLVLAHTATAGGARVEIWARQP